MRILILNPEIPFPTMGGAALRTYHLLQGLAAEHELTLLAFSWGAVPHAAPFPLRLETVPWRQPLLYEEMQSSEKAVAASALASLTAADTDPWFVSYYHSPEMEGLVRQVAKEGFDLVILEQSYMGRFLSQLPENIPTIMDFHDVHSVRAMRAVETADGEEKAKAQRELQRVLTFERNVAARCDTCVFVSAVEAALAGDLLGCNHAEVIPNGVDCTAYTSSEDVTGKDELLFVGAMNTAPNEDAVIYFTEEILPLILQRNPLAKFHIVGAKPTALVRALSSPHVEIHGQVADLKPFYDRASVTVIPIRLGSGTRLKALEAGASAKAIVTTSLGIEGLDFLHGRDLLVADSASEFANAVIKLCNDPDERRRLGRNARRCAESYDWKVIVQKFNALVGKALHKPRSSS
ncbi:MAG: polysaccharide biosynthesis protein PslH [Chthoniobacter sp.]|jgi:glycosyltransferase involved in cell wall biosynthesis|nr:polysaccharide biosynthesis protein PslH [Chthoniobacter sp.]